MAVNEKMYNELYRCRQDIKKIIKAKTGKTPLVCSDDALWAIADLCPKKLSDFESVPGIGQTFIKSYGQFFITRIRNYEETEMEKTVDLDPSVMDTLKELEKNLVSINKRNRLLYMARIASKYAFDLFDTGEDSVKKLLFGKSSFVTICNTIQDADDAVQTEEAKYKKLTQLLREVNKNLREKGQNDLYIGYPFVIGRLAGEDFDVRAPLALFPVIADRTSTMIRVRVDEARDVIYNNALILAHYKYNNISKPLPTDTIESYSEKTFIDSVLSFYAENDIKIQCGNQALRGFTEYKADEFPKYRSGELRLEPCAVLGKFPMCSSSIQKDFDDILKGNKINVLMNKLLLNADEHDFDLDTYGGEMPIQVDGKDLVVSEHDMFYINELNSAQENVLTAMNKLDELVVQGPPGTGKSQTIVSLIAEFVGKGKTVLMVSEKKTALDVVYSRLGNMSQYALMIGDVGNKDDFYRQLSRMVDVGDAAEDREIDIDGISDDIDIKIKKLERIANKLYAPNEFGIEPYKLYNKIRRHDSSDETHFAKIGAIKRKRDRGLLELKYEQIEKIFHRFSDVEQLRDFDRYFTMDHSCAWMKYIHENMSEYEISSLKESLNGILDWQAKSFFSRIFTKNNVNDEVKKVIEQYFVGMNKDQLLAQAKEIVAGLDDYEEYQRLKYKYNELDENERNYFRTLWEVRGELGGSLKENNSELFDELLDEHRVRFEKENANVLHDVDGFESVISFLEQNIVEKKDLTRKKLESILKDGMHSMKISKQHKEILRVLDSKRKWSVNKFISKFSYELFKSVKIWLLTPEVVSEIIPLETGIFDLVVFDEASQMYVEKGIPSIYRAKKVVVAGDHKQLRPSSLGEGRNGIDYDDLPEDAEVNAAIEEESLLDLARFRYQDVLLNFHYRSKYEELIAFSNYAYYKGRLYVSPNANPPELPPIQVHKMEEAMWVDQSNREEAKYIVGMLKQFFQERTEGETIGIITFNSKQRDLIEDLIEEECGEDLEFAASYKAELARHKDGEDIGLFIKNIENVQGDERDVIIFSIGYARNENGRLVRRFGWLNHKGGENRLNVAISRARKKIHIVTSFQPTELQVEDAKNEGPRLLKKYLEYAFAVSEGDKDSAKQILLSFGDESNPGQNISFDSDFENQVYDALTEKGYQVDTQVGIGGYRIDLAIKRDGKYILGIECDGRLYHSSKSARERDYHRQKYLESRGWRIHRIWSPNWWKHPEQEIEKICNVVDSLA